MPYPSWSAQRPDKREWDRQKPESSWTAPPSGPSYNNPGSRDPRDPSGSNTWSNPLDTGYRSPLRSFHDSGRGSRPGSDAGSAGARGRDVSGRSRGGRGYSRSRSRSRSREREAGPKPGPSLGKLLDAFASAMHASLLATSSLSIARNHLERLQSFPSTSAESPTIKEATSRVEYTQRKSKDRQMDMEDAFEDLMRKMGGGAGSGGSITAERDMQEVMARMKKLEGMIAAPGHGGASPKVSLDTPAPAPLAIPPPPVDPNPPPAPPDIEMVEPVEPIEEKDEDKALEKRNKAKDLLKTVLQRLAQVEDERKEIIDRVDDLENTIWDQAENGGLRMTWEPLELDRVGAWHERSDGGGKSRKRKRGREGDFGDGGKDRPIDVDGWEAFERQRDPEGVLRGRAVGGGRVADGGDDGGEDESGPKGTRGGVSGQGADAGEVERLRIRVEQLEKELRAVKESTNPATGQPTAPVAPAAPAAPAATEIEVLELRRKVNTVVEAMNTLISGQDAWKQAVVEACLKKLHSSFEERIPEVVKTHVQAATHLIFEERIPELVRTHMQAALATSKRSGGMRSPSIGTSAPSVAGGNTSNAQNPAVHGLRSPNQHSIMISPGNTTLSTLPQHSSSSPTMQSFSAAAIGRPATMPPTVHAPAQMHSPVMQTQQQGQANIVNIHPGLMDRRRASHEPEKTNARPSGTSTSGTSNQAPQNIHSSRQGLPRQVSSSSDQGLRGHVSDHRQQQAQQQEAQRQRDVAQLQLQAHDQRQQQLQLQQQQQLQAQAQAQARAHAHAQALAHVQAQAQAQAQAQQMLEYQLQLQREEQSRWAQQSQSAGIPQQQVLYGHPIYQPVNNPPPQTYPRPMSPTIAVQPPSQPMPGQSPYGYASSSPMMGHIDPAVAAASSGNNSQAMPFSPNMQVQPQLPPAQSVQPAKTASNALNGTQQPLDHATFIQQARSARRGLEKRLIGLPEAEQQKQLADYDKLCHAYLAGQSIDGGKLLALMQGNPGASGSGGSTQLGQSGSEGVQVVDVSSSGDKAEAGSRNGAATVQDGETVNGGRGKERQLSVSTNGEVERDMERAQSVEEGEIAA